MNPEIWKDPETWDPSRFDSERAEDKKAPPSLVCGLGVGQTSVSRDASELNPISVSTTKLTFLPVFWKFAKVEMAVLVAFFVTRYDFTVVDRDGKELKASQLPLDYRNFQLHKSDGLYVRYTERVGIISSG